MSQAIKSPIGMNVYGSALLRVSPDVASMTLKISSSHKKPNAAFEETRSRAKNVRTYLSDANIEDVRSSRITLSQEKEYDGNRWRAQGYAAMVAFHVIVEDLDRVEEVMCGAIDAGVNEVGGVDFQTRALKDYRAKARQNAVAAAKRKAQVYADAAGVELDRIIHIEDVNPAQTLGYRESHSEDHVAQDEDAAVSAFDPGAISVTAAVILSYSLKE